MRDEFTLFSQFLVRCWLRLIFDLHVTGRKNLPRSGATIVAANHVSGYDPFIVGCFMPRRNYYLAKKELFDYPVLGALLRLYRSIPIDRGGISVSALRKVRKVLNSGHSIVMFPEGTRSPDGRLQAPKEGIGLLLSQANAVVVPAYVDGIFGVKGSVFRRPKVKVHFGEQIDVGEQLKNAVSRRERYGLIAQAVMQGIARLAEKAQNQVTVQT